MPAFAEPVGPLDEPSSQPRDAVRRSPCQLGARPDPLSCGAISERMLHRDSDSTRLLDKLAERGLVKRARDVRDRRSVTTAISDAGPQLLRKLDDPVERVHRNQLKHMSPQQLETLLELAGQVYREST